MVESQSELKINDIFWTIQGEGYNWGRRALFVRLPFCNLACTWCDTAFNSFLKYSDKKFLEIATQEPSRFAVITGGEPTMNKQLPRVIELLKSEKFEIAIETNGTFPVPDGLDFITVSPKRDADYFIDPKTFERANEIKVVVDRGFDFAILNPFQTSTAILSLSPEFNDFENNVSNIINYIKDNPRWKLSLQTHKWIKVP